MPSAHAKCLAMLAPVMTMREGGRIYSPGGRLLEAGDRLDQPGLVAALEVARGRGRAHVLRGHARRVAARPHGGARRSRHARRPRRLPGRVAPARARPPTWASDMQTRGGLSQLVDTLVSLPPLRGASPADRARALARILAAPLYSGRTYEHTTNLCVVDAAGSACVVTTSLGLGSGDFLPGFDVHLNSMLGESDLLIGPLEPGKRMASMMSPTVALDDERARARRAARPEERACVRRSRRCSPGSSTNGSCAAGGGRPAPAPLDRRDRPRRARLRRGRCRGARGETATTSVSGTSLTTTSAASASSPGRVWQRIQGEAERP